MKKPRIRLVDRGDHHLGEIEVPMHAGSIRVQALGWNPMSALKRAASSIMQIANDPAIAAFLPPQVMAAAKIARALSKMGPDGLKTVAIEAESPATRKLAIKLFKALQKEQAAAKGEAAAEVSGPREHRRGRTGMFARKRRPVRRGEVVAPGPTSRSSTMHSDPAAQGFVLVDGRWERPQAAQLPPPPMDPYGQPTQPGAPYGQQAVPGMNPLDPLDAAAMQAWGPEAFEREKELEEMAPQQEAEDYFQAYEDQHYGDSADELLQYQEEGFE